MPVLTPRIVASSRGRRRATSASGNAMRRPRSTAATVMREVLDGGVDDLVLAVLDVLPADPLVGEAAVAARLAGRLRDE